MISLPQSFSVDKNRNIQSVVNFSAAVIVLYALISGIKRKEVCNTFMANKQIPVY